MSERLTSHEQHEQHAGTHEHHEAPKRPEVHHAALEKQRAEQLEASRQVVEQQAEQGRLLGVEEEDTHSSAHHRFASHIALKKDSYKNLLAQTRRQLPTVSRQFSKVVHQKNIEALSTLGAQTVARPSGLLGGGLGALLGSITLLYYSKHYGFTYNYAFFFITFFAGFAVGLLGEVLLRIVRRRKS